MSWLKSGSSAVTPRVALTPDPGTRSTGGSYVPAKRSREGETDDVGGRWNPLTSSTPTTSLNTIAFPFEPRTSSRPHTAGPLGRNPHRVDPITTGETSNAAYITPSRRPSTSDSSQRGQPSLNSRTPMWVGSATRMQLNAGYSAPDAYSSRASNSNNSHETPTASRRPRSSHSASRASMPGYARSSHGYTPRSRPASAPAADGQCVVSIIENRNRDIGIAVLNLLSSQVTMCQFTDSTSYSNSLMMCSFFSPLEILLPNTATNSKLTATLRQNFPVTNIVYVQRKLYNDTNGAIALKSIAAPDVSNFEFDQSSMRYLCLSAANALLKHVEGAKGLMFREQSVKVTFRGLRGHMLIDCSSVRNLELIRNNRTGDTSNTLFSVLDHTKTTMGQRLLRANLMQPLTDVRTIELRRDCVVETMQKEEFLHNARKALSLLPDIENILAQLVRAPTATYENARMRITNILNIKESLNVISTLSTLLNEGENDLLKAIRVNCSHGSLAAVKEEIERVIDPEAHNASKNAEQQRVQHCFAVRNGINALLDIGRRTFTEIIEDMYTMTEEYRSKYTEFQTSLKLQYNNSRGYYLTVSKSTILPDDGVCIQVTHNKKTISFTTEVLASLNNQLKDIIDEIYQKTDQTIEEMIRKVLYHSPALYRVVEAVSLLDLLLSFANVAKLNPDIYTAPIIRESGPFAARQAYHPVLLKLVPQECIANDVFFSPAYNFQVITGANMSGKSTYLKLLGLLAVVAHLGSLVPAAYATIPVIDRIFTRMGDDDDGIENGASTFMQEMKDVAHIIQFLSPSSLVLIDELGKGTSTQEGACIAWSVAEHLLSCKAYTAFATHFLMITQLTNLYNNVKQFQFIVGEKGDGKLDYCHKLAEGSASAENHYGIKLAIQAGMPSEIIESSLEAVQVLKEATYQIEPSEESQPNQERYNKAQMILNARYSTMDVDGLRRYFRTIQNSSNQSA